MERLKGHITFRRLKGHTTQSKFVEENTVTSRIQSEKCELVPEFRLRRVSPFNPLLTTYNTGIESEVIRNIVKPLPPHGVTEHPKKSQ